MNNAKPGAKPGREGATRTPRGAGASPLGANSAVARKLKEYYDQLVEEEVPDRFAQLLAQLERSEAEPKKD
jgi:hypothetical protein